MKIRKKQLYKSISILREMNINGYINDLEFDAYFSCFDEYWPTIKDGFEASIDFKDYDDSPNISLPQFINIATQLKNAVIDYEKGAAIADNNFLFCIDSSDYYSIELFENLIAYNKAIVTESVIGEKCFWQTQIIDKGCTITIFLLANTITVYHLLLEKMHDTSEYLPAYNPYDSFICITSGSKLTIEYAEELADSFLFELNSTLGLQFTRKIRPQMQITEGENIYKDCNNYEEYLAKKGEIENTNIQKYNSERYQLLPIICGRGLHEIIKIYNRSIEIWDTDYTILSYARIIEYVSPTIARQELIDTVLAHLALRNKEENFNVDFVLLLGEKYKKYDTMKDKDLCRVAISIVDFNYITDYAPEYMKRWADWNKPQKRKEIVVRIADSITATRNEIAHAKANYQRSGLECPVKYKDDFAAMMKKIAEFFIRWYSQQPVNSRVCD